MNHALELQLQNALWWQAFWLYVICVGLGLRLVAVIGTLLLRREPRELRRLRRYYAQKYREKE